MELLGHTAREETKSVWLHLVRDNLLRTAVLNVGIQDDGILDCG